MQRINSVVGLYGVGAILALAVAPMGCSDSGGGGSATDGGGGPAGGGGGTTGGSASDAAPGGAMMGAGGSPGASGSCNAPRCVADLAAACVPSGACMLQFGGTGINICYANGVKLKVSAGGATSTANFIKANGMPCYSIELPTMGGTAPSIWKNAAGMQVATSTTDAAGKTTITCTGGQPVVVDDKACQGMFADQRAATSCPMGACM